MVNTNEIRGLVMGYTRVSTREQGQSGGSLAAQAEAIRQWTKKNGHPIQMIYQDVGSAAGESLTLPELEQALREAQALGVPIVVTSPDRLFRNVVQAREVLRRFPVEVISLKHGGKISFNKLISEVKKAEAEAKRISSSTTKDLASKKAAGFKLGSPGDTHAANRASEKSRKISAHDKVLDIVDFLEADETRKSLSRPQLARALNDAGILTTTGLEMTGDRLRRPLEEAREELKMREEVHAEPMRLVLDPSPSAKGEDTAGAAEIEEREQTKEEFYARHPLFGAF